MNKWSRVTFTELLSAEVKIPWHSIIFNDFAIFHNFPGLENGLPKFHDFPWPGGTLKIFQLCNQCPPAKQEGRSSLSFTSDSS